MRGPHSSRAPQPPGDLSSGWGWRVNPATYRFPRTSACVESANLPVVTASQAAKPSVWAEGHWALDTSPGLWTET